MGMEQLEIVVEGASAPDLFFIEKDVPEAKVVEQKPPSGSSTTYGLPGLLEAVIILTAKGAIAGAVAWIVKNRKHGSMTVRRRTDPDGAVEESRTFEWTDESAGEGIVSKILAWVSGSSVGG
jgi:hypothetical protein